jgi:hypothetical protein
MPKHKILKDPDDLADRIGLKSRAPELKLGLGLDLGTTTGYACTWFSPRAAWVPAARPVYAGQLDLSVGDYDSGALRFVRLFQFLEVFAADVVFFEDVHGAVSPGSFGPHPTVAQVVNRVARPIELIGSFKGVVALHCELRNVPCKGFPLATVKKRATGVGNANKIQVILAANEEFGTGLDPEGYENTGVDNIADALFCLALGLEQYSRGIPAVAADPYPALRKRIGLFRS